MNKVYLPVNAIPARVMKQLTGQNSHAIVQLTPAGKSIDLIQVEVLTQGLLNSHIQVLGGDVKFLMPTKKLNTNLVVNPQFCSRN